MASYLYNKFKEQYRVIADYDQGIMDYPRIERKGEDGKITEILDPSFDDYYIPSTKYKLQIRHGVRNNLTCYFFSTQQMLNILYRMCKKEYGKEYERTPQNNNRVFEFLLKESLITGYEILDGEGWFSFKTDNMSIIAPYLKLKPSGVRPISPISVKNLPKSDYKIPKEEEDKYKEIIHKKILEMHEVGRIIKSANKEFDNLLTKKQSNEKKRLLMNYKQYASYKKLWEQYLSIIEKHMDKM